jgi:hypothetical protein
MNKIIKNNYVILLNFAMLFGASTGTMKGEDTMSPVTVFTVLITTGVILTGLALNGHDKGVSKVKDMVGEYAAAKLIIPAVGIVITTLFYQSDAEDAKHQAQRNHFIDRNPNSLLAQNENEETYHNLLFQKRQNETYTSNSSFINIPKSLVINKKESPDDFFASKINPKQQG